MDGHKTVPCVFFTAQVIALLNSRMNIIIAILETLEISRKPRSWTTSRKDVDEMSEVLTGGPRGKLRTGLPSVDQIVRLRGFVIFEMNHVGTCVDDML